MKEQFIVFEVAGTSYAIAMDRIAHVEMIEQVTRVPNAPEYVDGIVFSRGAVIPALNLRARFGFERIPYGMRTRLLVVQARERTIGLIVDEARQVETIPAAGIAPPNEGLTGGTGRYLEGIATVGDRLILVLDLEGLLDGHEALADAEALSLKETQ